MPAELPTGTVTLLFTDIEGSTRMLQELGREAYVHALTEHRRLLREAFTGHGGVEVEMQGDSFHFAFPYARDAVAAALASQRALAEHSWETEPIRVRIGLHTGEPMQADGLYAGLDVHHAARVMSAAHGGQILLSARTADLVTGELPDGVTLLDLGEHRLKDLTAPQRLYQAGDVGFPPLNTLAGLRTNLPAQPTRLVGRQRELSELKALLERPDVRLVTLTGPGGSGKTRLALQLAAERLGHHQDGVFACFLASVGEPTLLLPKIAEAIGLRDRPGRPAAETVTDYLGAGSILLLLDNLEHLLEAAPAVADLLARAPGLTIVATSRAPLRLAGEHLFDVPPLALPDKSAADPETLLRSEAVALFCERAAAARQSFELSAEIAPWIGEIVRRLDGLPLALELAAARLDLLPPDALLARLDRSLPLLTGGRRDADERQRTLRAAIEWSYDLLDEEEQEFFRALSALAGSFTLDAAEAVSGAEAGLDALEKVASLHEKNLLRRREGLDVEPRFFMLETIREYAAERAADHAETAKLRRRHTSWFLALAERGAPELTGPDQLLWLDRLEAEHDNLRAAFAHALAVNDADTALRFVGALYRFWDYRGHASECVRAAEQALALEGGTDRCRAGALFGAGFDEYTLGEGSASIGYLESALAAYRMLGDEREVARTLTELAWSRFMRNDAVEEVRAVALDALALARANGDRWCEALALQAVGVTGSPEERLGRLREAQSIFLEVGDEIYASRVLQNLCYLAIEGADYEEARDLAESALASSRRFGDRVLVAVDLLALGQTELLAGDPCRGTSSLREGLEIALEVGVRGVASEALRTLAVVAAAAGDAVRCGRLQGAAERLAEQVDRPIGDPVELALEERFLASARFVDAETVAAARAEGRELPLDAVVALALEVTAQPA